MQRAVVDTIERTELNLKWSREQHPVWYQNGPEIQEKCYIC
jgi:hypothetical protein